MFKCNLETSSLILDALSNNTLLNNSYLLSIDLKGSACDRLLLGDCYLQIS